MLLRPLNLPDFPWDLLTPARDLAARHPDGICDLSVGTPVDQAPQFIQDALASAANAHGYPPVVGTMQVREAIRAWGLRRNMVDVGVEGVIPTIGSKEAVAWIPFMLGVRPGDTVLVPEVAYPTYDIAARLAGATPVPVNPRRPDTWPDAQLVFLNTPGNPDGSVLSIEELRVVRGWARSRRAIVISDECYAELGWVGSAAVQVPSLLDEAVCDGDVSGLITLYSLSKQSNLAGYRAALAYGDPALIAQIAQVRKHSGLMVPGPVQYALALALADTAHVAQQKALYRQRRQRLLAAVEKAGFVNAEHSVAGLYLWLSHPGVTDSWELVDAFARLGILVAPGDFYGEAAKGHVRVALTASDERIEAAASRLESATELFA